MKYFNEKQFKKLEPIKEYLITVERAQFKKATTPGENEIAASVWEEYSGEQTQKSWGCANCVYNLFKKVAQVYFLTMKNNEEKKATQKKKNDTPKKPAPKAKTNNKTAKKK